MGEFVKFEVQDHIGIVTIHRPPVNAVCESIRLDLIEIFEGLNKRIDVYCVILRTIGPGFSGGHDLAESSGKNAYKYSIPRTINHSCDAIYRCRVPVIAAVHGYVIGMGLAYASICDMIVASDDASFKFPEINVGTVGGPAWLTRIMSEKMARYYLLTGEKISADWPGFVRRFVEAEHDALCMLLNGCQGDTNHINFMASKEERFPCGKGYPHAEYMGRHIANTVNAIWDKTAEMADQSVGAGVTTVYNKTRTDKEEFFDECWEVYEARAINHDYTVTKTKSGIELAEAYRVVKIRTEAPLYQKIPVTVLRVGEIGFVGFGGEPFTHYATAVRENFPGKTIIAACCANGYQGYLPTAKAFEQGGYEAISSPFSPNLEADCVAAATDIFKKLDF